MTNKVAIAAIALRISGSLLAQKGQVFPKIFAVAQYVYVETQYGPVDETVLDGRVTNYDRRAVADVEKAIQSWGRYKLTAKASEAELVFVVRPGSLAATNSGVHVSGGSIPVGGSIHVGSDVGGEVGSADDYLAVSVRDPNGKLEAPLWWGTMKHGLDVPALPLFKKFQDELETAAKSSKPGGKTPSR